MKTSSVLKNKIMQRVWYSYIISIVLSSMTIIGIVFGASSTLFIKLVSIPDILSNLLQVQLGTVPLYVWQMFAHAVTGGEFLKLLTLGLIIFSLLSFRFVIREQGRTMRYV